MAKWEAFSQCPGCGYNLLTDEGERSCAWGDCPYLPLELDVFCPTCRFNFMTGEGNPSCEHPSLCEDAAEARSNVGNLQTWAEAHPRQPSA